MTKKSTSTARKNAVVARKNEGGVGPKLDWTDQWQMTTGRYADPLIVQKMHNKQVPLMREVVAEADPIAAVLTHLFAEGASAKMIKFYASDQLDSPEIMQDLRAMLKMFKFQEYQKEVILRGQTHGWWLIYPFVDENGIPNVEIYSEYECEPLRIHYDLNNNIQWYDIHFIPRVGFSRNTALRAVNRRFTREQVMHGTRGTWRYGFGYSILEGSWDAITKLREESHTNAFKQKIMPFVRVPDAWSKEQIDNFMAALAKIDMMSAMVMKAPLNEMTGEYQELPAVTWATPANNTPAKSTQGGGGSVSDLSSEWSRLTGATRRSVAYFVGGGALSASRAAAGVDSLDDLDADIQDFNQYIDGFIIPFVKWFAAVVGYQLPDSFTVKGWWEWTRDEALYNKILNEQQKQQAMQQIQQDQLEDKDRQNLLAEIKLRASQKEQLTTADKEFQRRLNQKQAESPNKPVDVILMEVVGEITHEQRVNYAAKQINEQYEQLLKPETPLDYRMALMAFTINVNRHNIIANTVIPVNSISGNTEYAFLEDTPESKALWVKFKSPYNWYRYQEGDADLDTIADRVVLQGGDAVWDDLRGLGKAPRDEEGKLPAGRPRYRGAKTTSAPLAGRPHDAYGLPYQSYGTNGPKGPMITDLVEEGRLDPAFTGEPIAPAQIAIDAAAPMGATAPSLDVGDYAQTSAQEPQTAGIVAQPEAAGQTTQPLATAKKDDGGLGDIFKSLFMKSLKKSKVGRLLSAGTEIFKGLFGESRANIGIPVDMDDEIPKTLFLHPLLQENNSVSGMRKNLKIGYEKAHEMLDQVDANCERWNLAALATAMHTKNPFIYKMDQGYRIEYICPDSIRQLKGAKVPYGLWHNLDNEALTTLPEWQIIGYYQVDDITDEKDISHIEYLPDWEEKATKIIARLKKTAYYRDPTVKQWVDNYIENVKKGLHGDVSTGITTDVKYDKEKNRWIQTNIKLNSVSAVPIGNCSSPFCATKNLA